MPAKSKSNFTKTLLQSYVITNCERRIFFELGRSKPNLWFDPVRPIPMKPPERLIFQRKYLIDKGIEYEQEVYLYLKKLTNTPFKAALDASFLTKCYDELTKKPKETIMLLEYQYKVPASFISSIFPPKPSTSVIPVDYSDQRPDIVLLGNDLNKHIDTKEVFEVTHNGTVRKVSVNELVTRMGITIFDVKYVQDDRVGKKHFLEIFYYLKTLAAQIKELNLQDKYYVRANLNGIFPFHVPKELRQVKSIDDLFELDLVNIISWKEANRIFLQVIEIIKGLWSNSPCPIEQVDINFHQGCGYCKYIEDCNIKLS